MEWQTKDLTLRTVTSGDLEEVARMWDFEKGRVSLEEAQKAIDFMEENHRRNRIGCLHHLCLAVFEKGNDAVIGWCGLDGRTPGALHIFYMIDRPYRNKGYASQCAERLLSHAFEEAAVPFVNGGCAKENIASFRVMQKAGMQPHGFEDNGDPLFYLGRDLYLSRKK